MTGVPGVQGAREGRTGPCHEAGADLSDLLERMSSVLSELACEISDLQKGMSPLIESGPGLDPGLQRDLQRLDRHAQYLVELGRMSQGLSAVTATRSISTPALCRLVRLPSLRNRFLAGGDMIAQEGEEGSVSLF